MKKPGYVLDSFAVLAYFQAEAGMDRVLAAAHIKAHYAISYADAFVVSLAQEVNATIVTADPEFKKVQSLAEILWL